MELNVKEIRVKLKLTQQEAANLIGVSRYFVNMAERQHNNIISIPAQKYLDAHNKVPDVIVLPDDFFHYTKPTICLNCAMQGVFKSHIPDIIYADNQIYLYDKKEMIDKIFSTLYLPYHRDKRGKWVELEQYDHEAFIKNIKEQLQKPSATFKDILNDNSVKSCSDFNKYLPFYVKCNLAYYNISEVALAKYLSTYPIKLSRWLKRNDITMAPYKEELERLFPIFIYPGINKKIIKPGNEYFV